MKSLREKGSRGLDSKDTGGRRGAPYKLGSHRTPREIRQGPRSPQFQPLSQGPRERPVHGGPGTPAELGRPAQLCRAPNWRWAPVAVALRPHRAPPRSASAGGTPVLQALTARRTRNNLAASSEEQLSCLNFRPARLLPPRP